MIRVASNPYSPAYAGKYGLEKTRILAYATQYYIVSYEKDD